MACSKYQYVKKFEQNNCALLQTYIVVRVDGKGFTKFCAAHQFKKPNDLRAIKLMNAAAQYVCHTFTQIFLAYGQSDQYSFSFNKNTTLFSRRTDKILSCVVSAFTSAYVFNWKNYFDIELIEIPTFDSRVVVYPNQTCLKDYFRWRQVDCHINNLYNTIFWEIVRTGKSNQEVQKFLKDTDSAKKNQILFADFGINYNNIEEVYRRGTLFYYTNEIKQIQKQVKKQQQISKKQLKQEKNVQHKVQQIKMQQCTSEQQPKTIKSQKKKVEKTKRKLTQSHKDCIKEQFWTQFFP